MNSIFDRLSVFYPFLGLIKVRIVWFSIQVPIAANCKDVCLQNTSKSHSYHLKIWLLL